MNAFQIACLGFGGVMIVGALAVAVGITVLPRLQTRDAAFILATASLLGGLLVASIATPDWNPFTMAALYAPFLLIGVYSATVAALRGRTNTASRG
jgi:hypothetical protein